MRLNWVQYEFLGLLKHFHHGKLAFLRNLPLEMHNFIIFPDKLYLETDCNAMQLVKTNLAT